MKRLGFALFSIAGLAACVSGGPAPGVVAGQPFPISPGEHVALPDRSRLHYVELVDDSRCPPDVHCIRAGDATVAFSFTPAGGIPERITLNTDEPASVAIGRWQLQLLELSRGPAPVATMRADAR